MLKGYRQTGVHFTSPRVLHKWFKRAGFRIERILNFLPIRAGAIHQMTLGLMDSWLAEDLLVVARRRRSQPHLAASAEMARAVKRAS